MDDDLLDIEFRQILYIIKPLINNINDHYNLEMYRLWLERLSAVTPPEKLERNKFLVELANQIHDNVLKPPFTYKPPRGLLPTLKSYKLIQEDPERISEHFFKKEDTQWPYLTTQSQNILPKSSKRHLSTKESLCSYASYYKKKNSKIKTIKPFQKIGSISKSPTRSETSSWYDLSDGTTVTEVTDDDLKDEIKKKCVKNKKSKEAVLESGDNNKSRRPTQQEVEALKMRMKDLMEVKNALRDTHCLTEDRKKIIESLQNKLAQAEKETSELKARISALEQAKRKELNDFKEKFSVLRQKELDYLKKVHKDEVAALEKEHNHKIEELDSKIASLTKEHDEKIKKINESNKVLLRQKENEIKQLQKKVLKGGSNEEINNLKRQISKLDKTLTKNEKDYFKKIDKLKQEMEVKEATNKVQLQTQRADLLMRSASFKQEELKNALNSLEGKYRKMIEALKYQAMETKKHDEETIDHLKDILDRHNIEY